MLLRMLLTSLSHVCCISAHMVMSSPIPYGKSTLDNSPLNASGSDFPCKLRPGVYDAEGAMNFMELGSSQPLAFIGGATHGGGSCQISITYDANPTSSSTWKVIHSIEGGCPIRGQAGNIGNDASAPDPDTYAFTVPTVLPTGAATLAWTWFNKIGNREMYMNCAPITLTGRTGSSSLGRRSKGSSNAAPQLICRDQAAYETLPDMFVANIDNGCGTLDSTDLKFPDPGDSLELLGTATATPQLPTGPSCPPINAAAAPPSPQSAINTVGQSNGAVSSSLMFSFATSASVPTSSYPVMDTVTSTTSSTIPENTPSISLGSGAMDPETACSPEGSWNCIGGTSYQRCASGLWSVVQELAAGTVCPSGVVTDLDITDAEGAM
ncbi:glycoside hydrolase [Xylogone sp. PMI_703]|nr:glycoside hydrolase [Xylogone sp. PMI_703]KAH8798333.1 glycoside hydrolase [Xylogone sp. PMI_703]